MNDLLAVSLVVVIIAIVIYIILRANRRERYINDFLAEARRTNPLFSAGSAWSKAHFQLVRIGTDESRRQRCVLVVSDKHLAVYVLEGGAIRRCFAAVPADLRWFGRPQKYRYGSNTIWLHYEIDRTWQLLKLDMHITQMYALVRALKTIASDDLVTAYRRRRPYIHHGPVVAAPAAQDIHGAWTLAEPVALYIMPTQLVILEDSVVAHTIPIREIAAVERVRRKDMARRGGLVRFVALGETLAYALDDDETFAQQLSSAARAELEEITRKQKKFSEG